jgi:hypothetical protein
MGRHTKVECGLFLDVVVRKRTTILEFLAGENQTSLIGRDVFLDIIDGIQRLDLKGDSLAC